MICVGSCQRNAAKERKEKGRTPNRRRSVCYFHRQESAFFVKRFGRQPPLPLLTSSRTNISPLVEGEVQVFAVQAQLR